MGCISSAPVEPEGDEFEGDPLADLKRRKRDLEQEVKGAQEYGQALLASQAELLQAQAQKEQDRKKYYREHAFLWRAVEVCQRRWSDADHMVGCDEHALEVYKRHVIHTDYKEIVEACKGMGCDEKRISKVTNARTRHQLQDMQKLVEAESGVSIFKMIRGESWSFWTQLDDGLSDFARLCTWRMMPDARQTAYFLQRKMGGFFSDPAALCEILSTRTNEELRAAAQVYEKDTGKSLSDALKHATGGTLYTGDYGKWIARLAEFDREEGWAGSPQQLEDEAHRLYKACEANLISTDEGPFLEILAKASPEHIAYLEQAYENHPKTKRSLRKTLEKGLSGNFRTALLAHCTPKWEFLAHRLHVATKVEDLVDTGTDEEIICRILASCSKNDIFYNLIPTYDQMYAEKDKKDFQAMMKSECSGDFLQAIQDVTTSYPPCGHLLEPERATYEGTTDETRDLAYQALQMTYNYETAGELGARYDALVEATAWDLPFPTEGIDSALCPVPDTEPGYSAQQYMFNTPVGAAAVPNSVVEKVMQAPPVPIDNLIVRSQPYTTEGW
jgi:uncharacterized protein (UPF0335 family)